jgi:cytochrome c-type biogenesis protein CcmH/NrfG
MAKKNNKQKTIAIFMAIMFVASIFVASAGYFTMSNNSQSSNSNNNNTQQTANVNDQSQIANYKKKLAENPQDVEAMVNLGHAYYDQKNYEMAIKYYKDTLELQPNNLHVIVDLGTAYYYQTNPNPEKAVELYNRALEINPKFKNALFNKGVVFQYGVQDYQRAVKSWEAYLAEYPQGEMADKAKEFMVKAKNLANSSEQNSNQQQFSSQSSNQQLTIADYKQRLGENPQDVEAMINLGHAYYDQKNYEKAINYYESSLNLEPKSVGVLVDLGTAYYYKANSNPEKAVELYNRALEIDSTFKNALFNKGIVLQSGLHDYSRAIKAWEDFLSEYSQGQMADKAKQFLNEAKNNIN